MNTTFTSGSLLAYSYSHPTAIKQGAVQELPPRDQTVDTHRTHAHLVVTFAGYKLIAVGSLVVAVATACRFVRYKGRKTWEQAKQTCTQEGMQLATIPDAEFDSSLYSTSCDRSEGSTSSGQDYWIGARVSMKHNQQVDWIEETGSVCSVTKITGAKNLCNNLQPGECVWVNIQDGQRNMHMHGGSCNSSHGFVCESLPTGGE